MTGGVDDPHVGVCRHRGRGTDVSSRGRPAGTGQVGETPQTVSRVGGRSWAGNSCLSRIASPMAAGEPSMSARTRQQCSLRRWALALAVRKNARDHRIDRRDRCHRPFLRSSRRRNRRAAGFGSGWSVLRLFIPVHERIERGQHQQGEDGRRYDTSNHDRCERVLNF